MMSKQQKQTNYKIEYLNNLKNQFISTGNWNYLKELTLSRRYGYMCCEDHEPTLSYYHQLIDWVASKDLGTTILKVSSHTPLDKDSYSTFKALYKLYSKYGKGVVVRYDVWFKTKISRHFTDKNLIPFRELGVRFEINPIQPNNRFYIGIETGQVEEDMYLYIPITKASLFLSKEGVNYINSLDFYNKFVILDLRLLEYTMSAYGDKSAELLTKSHPQLNKEGYPTTLLFELETRIHQHHQGKTHKASRYRVGNTTRRDWYTKEYFKWNKKFYGRDICNTSECCAFPKVTRYRKGLSYKYKQQKQLDRYKCDLLELV